LESRDILHPWKPCSLSPPWGGGQKATEYRLNRRQAISLVVADGGSMVNRAYADPAAICEGIKGAKGPGVPADRADRPGVTRLFGGVRIVRIRWS
jgi:hypothetical protein